MGGFVEKLKQWWTRTDRNQRVVTLGGIGVLVLLLVGSYVLLTRPKYEILYANLSEQDQSAVVTELQNMGIDVRFDRAGVVEVPASEKAAARVRLAASNKLPRAQGHWGLGELNTMPFGMTPNVETERLTAIKEGEIAKSLEAMDGVESATVHLTEPSKSAFTIEQTPASASVSIVQSDDTLGPNQGRSIALLVKNAVDGLDMKDIVVVNQHLQTIWNGEDEADNGVGGANHKTDIDEEVSKQREHELQALMDQAYGAGAAIVSVHADVDMDPAKTVLVERTPSKKASAEQTSTEDVKGNSPTVGGKTGLNGLGAPTAGAGSGSQSGSYNGSTATKEYLSNEKQVETQKAIGAIKGMAVNVVVDSAKIADPKPVEQMLIGDLGDKIQLDASGNPKPNQNFSVKVTSVQFDKTASTEAAKAAAAAATQQRIQQIISMLPILALIGVAVMVMKQIGKFAKTQLNAPVTALTTEGIAVPLGAGPQRPVLPDGELHSLLAQIESNQDAEHERAERRARAKKEEEELEMDIEDIKNRVHIPLEQLKKMANERPAIVAQLIKSMLLEERK